MASDADVGDDPPSQSERGSSGSGVRSVRTSGNDPPNTPLGPFVGARSFLRRGMMNISSSLRNTSPQDLSEQTILPHESRTFDNVAAQTIISNQNRSVTDASVTPDPNVLNTGTIISPESTQQQQ